MSEQGMLKAPRRARPPHPQRRVRNCAEAAPFTASDLESPVGAFGRPLSGFAKYHGLK